MQTGAEIYDRVISNLEREKVVCKKSNVVKSVLGKTAIEASEFENSLPDTVEAQIQKLAKKKVLKSKSRLGSDLHRLLSAVDKVKSSKTKKSASDDECGKVVWLT